MIGTASTLVPPPAAGAKIRKERFRTANIIDVVQDISVRYVHETKRFSRQFSPDKQGLKKLYDWVDHNFRYREDPDGIQAVQTPAYINKGRIGDCKSFTAFISTVLQNLGIDSYNRYAAYGTSDYRHVYPVAILKGEEIPLDVVWKKQEGGHFGGEKPYTKKKDIMAPGLYQLGNTRSYRSPFRDPAREAAIIGQLKMTLKDIQQLDASLPEYDRNNDVTRKSKGDLTRQVMEDRFLIMASINKGEPQIANQYRAAARAMSKGDMAALGSLKDDAFGRDVQKILADSLSQTQRAFENFTIEIPDPVSGRVSGITINPALGTCELSPELGGLFSGIGKFFKKVGDFFSKAFKKVVNWIFSGAGKAMGPFFIFHLLKGKNKVKSPNIRRRMAAQEKTFNWVRRIGKFDENQLKGLAMNGILERTRKTPEQIAVEGGVPQIAGAGLVTVVIKAISFVVKVVEKIAGLFKRRGAEAGPIDETTMSDTRLFCEEERLQLAANRSDGVSEGGVSKWVVGAGIALSALKIFT